MLTPLSLLENVNVALVDAVAPCGPDWKIGAGGGVESSVNAGRTTKFVASSCTLSRHSPSAPEVPGHGAAS